MRKTPLPVLPGFRVHHCDLLHARVIIATYNQHVRSPSSRAFGCLSATNLLGSEETDDFMKSVKRLETVGSLRRVTPTMEAGSTAPNLFGHFRNALNYDSDSYSHVSCSESTRDLNRNSRKAARSTGRPPRNSECQSGAAHCPDLFCL